MSTNTVHVGDLFELEVSVRHPSDVRVRLPDPDRPPAVVLRDRQREETRIDDTQTLTRVVYTLASFETGYHLIQTNHVVFLRGDNTPEQRPYPDVGIEVASLVDEGSESPAPIKDVLEWPKRFPRWIPGMLLIVLLAALAGLLAARWLNKRQRSGPEPPPVPPHEQAIKALRDLRAGPYIQELNVEPFYVELSRIVRRYLEDRFHLRAPEQTTEEFIREAASSRALSAGHQALVSGFLEESDLVKFARHHPGRPEMESALDAGERLVQETMPGGGAS